MFRSESLIRHWRILQPCVHKTEALCPGLILRAENLSQQKANMEAALGRIVDVDVAAESSRLARNNVLVQASAAMLAQANSTPEIALMLLR